MSAALTYIIFIGSNITFHGSHIAFPGMPSNLSIASVATQIPSIGPTVNQPTSAPAPGIQTRRPDHTNDTTSPEVNPGQALSPSDHYKIVCHFMDWSSIRPLPVVDIDHTLCTHIVLGYALLDDSDLVMKTHPSWTELDNQFYARLIAYKQRGLKVLLALGGWGDSGEDKYSRLVNSADRRQKFVIHAVNFIEKYGMDGLDFDWEWPGCWQTRCSARAATDKEGFSLLVKELSSAFKPKGLLLSAIFGQTEQYIDTGYDVPVLAKYLDWISVVTYDYHGEWNADTGHHAPLYQTNVRDPQSYTVDSAIRYLISKGAPPRKIVMGIALYGRSFTLTNPERRISMNVPAARRGEAGEFTKNPGFLAYYEICERIHNRGWTVVSDPLRRTGPYAYKGNQWVGFDDADMVRRKAQYIKDMNLGGGMVKGIDIDDFKGNCGEGVHPLMHALRQALADPLNGYNAWRGPSSDYRVDLATSASQELSARHFRVTTIWAYRPTVSGTHSSLAGFQSFFSQNTSRGFAPLPCIDYTELHRSACGVDCPLKRRVVLLADVGLLAPAGVTTRSLLQDWDFFLNIRGTARFEECRNFRKERVNRDRRFTDEQDPIKRQL